MSALETLRRVPLFNELSEVELDDIAARITESRYSPGQVVFSEGDPGRDLLIVQEGRVRVVKTSARGRHQLLAIEHPGSSLGEVSVFDGGAYSTSAIAIESVVLLRLRGEHFRSLCLANPWLALKVIRVLGHRLRHLRGLVEDLSFATVRNRLVAHILHLADEQGRDVVFDENNEDLAARLGTVRELVSRNLGRLHNEGLIVMRRRRLTILDMDRLRAELET